MPQATQPLGFSALNPPPLHDLAEALARYLSGAWILAMRAGPTPAEVVAAAEVRDALGATERDWQRHLRGAGRRHQQLDQHVRRVRARGDAPVPMLGLPGDRNRSVALADLGSHDLPDPQALRAAVADAVRGLVADLQGLERELQRDTGPRTGTRFRRRRILASLAAAVPAVDPVWDPLVRKRVILAGRLILAARESGRALTKRVTAALVAFPWRRRAPAVT